VPVPRRADIVRDPNLYIGLIRFELFVPDAHSLKDKRRHTRSLVEHIRNRHQVQILEVDHQAVHQRAGFAVSALSTAASEAEQRLDRVRQTVDERWPGHVLSWDVDIMQLEF
jgi:uncharacterized protein YlxP (DUF503 family)